MPENKELVREAGEVVVAGSKQDDGSVLFGYLVRFEVFEYRIDFTLWDRYSADESEEDREQFGDGHLKWDGCCNLHLDTSACMLHFCGPEEDPVLGQIMRAVYALGPKMPAWDHGGGA